MNFSKPGRINIREFSAVVNSCIATYMEVIRTGGIQCTAQGDNISILLKANVCGDILLFFEPTKNTAHSQIDVNELILADKSLEQQKEAALISFRQKFHGLLLLPQLIVWTISIVLSGLIYFNSGWIHALVQGKLNPIFTQYILPILIPALIIYFRKAVGFGVISLSFRLIRHFAKS